MAGSVGDAGGVVAGAGGAVEHGKLAAVEAAGEQLDELGQEEDPLVRAPAIRRSGGRSSGLSVTASGPASGR